jgi:hypothetical protein
MPWGGIGDELNSISDFDSILQQDKMRHNTDSAFVLSTPLTKDYAQGTAVLKVWSTRATAVLAPAPSPAPILKGSALPPNK